MVFDDVRGLLCQFDEIGFNEVKFHFTGFNFRKIKNIVDQVQTLIQQHSTSIAGIAGPHAEVVGNTLAALQKYHAAQLASGRVGTEEIEIAFLLGNGSLNHYILAISIGSVFFGAATYIGNGPNFMVKAIADLQNVPTPGFLGLIFKYTLPCLAPVLLLVWLLFFRG